MRRLLALLPALVCLAAVIFALLTPRRPGGAARFFDAHPRDVRDASASALILLADGRDAGHAGAELARLGGAALPWVLPRLDTLAPAERARVARALGPVARRMGLGEPEDFATDAAAVLFWTRFWADRGPDFHPGAVRRVVARLGERSLAQRRDDVSALDTYALPALLDGLRDALARDDVAAARRYARAAAHAAELPWTIPADADLASARAIGARWRRWWIDERANFSVFDGLDRAVAAVSETQFGHWSTALFDERGGSLPGGGPRLATVAQGALVSLLSLAAALALLLLLALAWAYVDLAARSRGLHRLLMSAAAIPLSALVLATPDAAHVGLTLLAGVVVCRSAALAAARARAAAAAPYARAARAVGLGPRAYARRALREAAATALAAASCDVGVLVLAAWLDRARGVTGVWSLGAQAFASRDAATLVLVAATGLVLVALLDAGLALVARRTFPDLSEAAT